MSDSFAVRAENLVKVYEGTVRALDGVTLSVEEGELRAIVGPNGAGKTTLMRILTTQIKPTSGDAWVLGHHVVREAGKVRGAIGYVPQEFSVWNDLTGYENLLVYAKLYGIPRDRRKRVVEEMLEFMELKEAANRLIRTYSGGMIRRLELAIALMVKPRVLFLDEPTIGLDPRARALVWSRVLEYKKEYGATVVFNTHYMDEAERYSEVVTMMNRGRIVAEGEPGDLAKAVGEGDLVSLSLEGDTAKALDALSRVPELAVVSAKNPVLVKVENAQRQLPYLMEALMGNGVRVKEVGIRRPTLEDVFVKLTGMTVEEAEALGFRGAAAMRRAIRRGG